MSSRWPANVILSPGMAEVLDEQSGFTKSKPIGNTINVKAKSGQIAFGDQGPRVIDTGKGDSGGASRFFLTAGYEPWELEWIIANGLTPCGT